MKKRNYLYLCLMLMASLFTSCNHYFYTPPEANLLMLSEQGDLKVSAGAGFSILDEGSYSFQAGYSPIKNLGLAINYFQVGQAKKPTAESDDRVSSFAFEGAIGTYYSKTINGGTDENTYKNNKLILDLYGGYGRSDIRKVFYTGGDVDFNAQHYFLQGGIHFQSHILGVSYTLRGVRLDYIDGSVYGQIDDRHLVDIADLENDPFSFLESSVRLRAGGQKLKCFISRNWMTHPFKNKQLEYSNSSWHMGVVIDVHQFFKKKDS